MKLLHRDQCIEHKNDDTCIVRDYPFGNKLIDGAIIEISGRYPKQGKAMNSKCTLVYYIIEGSGVLQLQDEKNDVAKGDVVLIEPGDSYNWEGNMTIFISSTPAWSPDQYSVSQ